jgi:hypothetical protein
VTADQLASIFLKAVGEERDRLGCSGVEAEMLASDILDNIVTGVRAGIAELGDQ